MELSNRNKLRKFVTMSCAYEVNETNQIETISDYKIQEQQHGLVNAQDFHDYRFSTEPTQTIDRMNECIYQWMTGMYCVWIKW